jgi:hypothetical protein
MKKTVRWTFPPCDVWWSFIKLSNQLLQSRLYLKTLPDLCEVHLLSESNSFTNVTYEYVPYSAFTGENIGAIAQTDVMVPGGT